MKSVMIFSRISLAFLLLLLISHTVMAQAGYQFGQNKVHYKDFDWKIFRSEHFDVHYYPEEEQAAHDAARMAERGYEYLGKTLNHEIKARIPLILYASLNDFQQTNVVGGLIGEGTRGVTESLKNRVVLPLTGFFREFNHVLVHELVHAFQFDIMSNGISGRPANVPLWVVEGMAEYLSNNMDNTTRMWVRDGLEHDRLMTVSQLNSAFDIRVYRLGQSFWHYIGETYGKEMVGTLFKSAVGKGGFERALQEHLKLSEKEATAAWHEFARGNVQPKDSTMQLPADIARKLTRQRGYYHRLNLVPSLGPDGKQLAYIANKNLKEEIFLLSEDSQSSFIDERLVEGGDSKNFEALRFFDTAIGWSRDGSRIAFVSKSGQDDALYIMDPHQKKILQRFVFSALNGLQSPTFSPEGNRLAFSGISGGISDLYLLNLADGSLDRRTNDRFAVLHPQWSPDGGSIVFATDRGPDADEAQLIFSDYDLACYHLADGSIELLTDLPGSAVNPQWSPDGSKLAFISDHQGIPNLYLLDLPEHRLRRLTSLRSGVTGITSTTPAFSWSANGERMVFSAFQENAWDIYRVDAQVLLDAAVDSEVLTAVGSATPPLEIAIAEVDTLTGETNGQMDVQENAASHTESSTINNHSSWIPELPDPNSLYSTYSLADPDSLEPRDYSRRFKLDAIGVGAGIGGFFGSVGAAQFLFSDMLGNHNLILSTEVTFSDLNNSDFGLTYFNQSNRINVGVQAFQTSLAYSLFQADANTLGFLRNTYRGINVLAAYPFSRFSRLEVFGGFTRAYQDVVTDEYTRSGIDRSSSTIGSFSYAQAGAALVFDNTLYGPVGPTGGSRSRFSIESTSSDFQFTNVQADYRSYRQLPGRSVLAYRLSGGSSSGKDRQVFTLGGPFSYRGSDYSSILGPTFILSNLEYRFPLFGLLTPRLDFLSGAAFVDAAGAWGLDVPGVISKTFQPFSSEGGLRLNDLNAAYGLGARLNLGYFYLGYNVAWPTDLQSSGPAFSQFSLGTFF